MLLSSCMSLILSVPLVWALSVKDATGELSKVELKQQQHNNSSHFPIAPKVLIVNLYAKEGESFFHVPQFNVLAQNITVPGLSPLFPAAHCTADGSVCEVITGEGEINAASSITALVFSHLFDLRHTYFLVAGIAGINPKVATIGSVTLARYAVQVDLENEFDPRELPKNYTTGYLPLGSMSPDQYSTKAYGTEVFELNQNLLKRAIDAIKAANVTLDDAPDAAAYRAKFNGSKMYAAAARPPAVVQCDTVTSNVYFSGTLLNEAFDNYTNLVTNRTGRYCASQQEDNAVLEAVLRGNLAKRTDFSRVVVMRTASDFVSPPPGVSALDNLFYEDAGYIPALHNLAIAGVPIVQDIVKRWSTVYRGGVRPSNYIGDNLGSLGGKPNFGLGPVQEPKPLKREADETRTKGRRRARADAVSRGRGLPSLRLNARLDL